MNFYRNANKELFIFFKPEYLMQKNPLFPCKEPEIHIGPNTEALTQSWSNVRKVAVKDFFTDYTAHSSFVSIIPQLRHGLISEYLRALFTEKYRGLFFGGMYRNLLMNFEQSFSNMIAKVCTECITNRVSLYASPSSSLNEPEVILEVINTFNSFYIDKFKKIIIEEPEAIKFKFIFKIIISKDTHRFQLEEAEALLRDGSQMNPLVGKYVTCFADFLNAEWDRQVMYSTYPASLIRELYTCGMDTDTYVCKAFQLNSIENTFKVIPMDMSKMPVNVFTSNSILPGQSAGIVNSRPHEASWMTRLLSFQSKMDNRVSLKIIPYAVDAIFKNTHTSGALIKHLQPTYFFNDIKVGQLTFDRMENQAFTQQLTIRNMSKDWVGILKDIFFFPGVCDYVLEAIANFMGDATRKFEIGTLLDYKIFINELRPDPLHGDSLIVQCETRWDNDFFSDIFMQFSLVKKGQEITVNLERHFFITPERGEEDKIFAFERAIEQLCKNRNNYLTPKKYLIGERKTKIYEDENIQKIGRFMFHSMISYKNCFLLKQFVPDAHRRPGNNYFDSTSDQIFEQDIDRANLSYRQAVNTIQSIIESQSTSAERNTISFKNQSFQKPLADFLSAVSKLFKQPVDIELLKFNLSWLHQAGIQGGLIADLSFMFQEAGIPWVTPRVRIFFNSSTNPSQMELTIKLLFDYSKYLNSEEIYNGEAVRENNLTEFHLQVSLYNVRSGIEVYLRKCRLIEDMSRKTPSRCGFYQYLMKVLPATAAKHYIPTICHYHIEKNREGFYYVQRNVLLMSSVRWPIQSINRDKTPYLAYTLALAQAEKLLSEKIPTVLLGEQIQSFSFKSFDLTSLLVRGATFLKFSCEFFLKDNSKITLCLYLLENCIGQRRELQFISSYVEKPEEPGQPFKLTQAQEAFMEVVDKETLDIWLNR